jgi:hypothetical protein
MSAPTLSPAGPSRPGAAAVSVEGLTALTTEHYTLQSARAATTHESNGRASLYLASVAGGVIALTYVADSTGAGSTASRLFAATVLTALTLMGLLTHQRLVHLAVEDATLAQAIGRIRGGYLALAPDIAGYLLLPAADDRDGAVHSAGVPHSRWHHLSHMAVMVAVVVSAVLGTGAAMTAFASGSATAAGVALGAATATATFAVLVRRQVRAWHA